MKRNYRKKCSGSACFGRKYAVLYNYCWFFAAVASAPTEN